MPRYLIIKLFYPCALLFLSATTMAAPSVKITNDQADLIFKKGHFLVKKAGHTTVKLDQISFNYEAIDDWQVQQHDDKKMTLLGELPASVDFYRVVTDRQKRFVKLTVSATDNGFRFYAAPDWGRQVTLQFSYLGDHFFGLSAPLQPHNQLSADLTGMVTSVDIYSEGAAYRENYASAFSSFYMSSNGYGAFYDSFARGRYEFALNGKNTIHHDTGVLDWHILLGDDGREIHKAYFKLVGKPKFVPVWALGPVGWRDQNNGGAQEILDDVSKLSEMRIPFTSWFVDRPYSDGHHAWSKMNFNASFANPKTWIATLKEQFNLEFMTWVSPATFGDTRFNKHLTGKFSYIDLSDENSVKAYQNDLAKHHYQVGVKGHKIDRADEGFPVSETWQDQTPVAERRNKYAYLMAEVHDQAARRAWGQDQVTFARTAIHGTQPYLSAIWGGDPRTSWEGMQGNLANAMRSSFMGFPVWGTDVGGYQGEGYIPEDLYLRWMQLGSMTGFFEIKLDGAGGDGRDRMPWQYDAEFQQRFKAICDDRMRLLPYIFSLANNSAEQGVMMQPMAYRHLDDTQTYDIWDQFYFGDAILVAPVLEAGNQRSVYLPKGQWRSFDQPAQTYKGGREYSVNAGLDQLPRFIKANSIFVSGGIYQGSDVRWQAQADGLTLHVYPAVKAGETNFTYVDGLDDNRHKKIIARRKGKVTEVFSPVIESLDRILIYSDKNPKKVEVNGVLVQADYNKSDATLTVKVNGEQENRVRIEL